MKLYILILIFFLRLPFAQSQPDTIPNSDFEYWHPGGSSYCFNDPDYWNVICHQMSGLGINKDTDSYNGNYALMGHLGGQNWPMAKTNFYLNWHPAVLKCYVKADSLGDSIAVKMTLFNNSTVVDSGSWIGTSLSNVYAPVIIPLTQNSSIVDSASILITGYANTLSIHYFWVDYLSLDSLLTIHNFDQSSSIIISPIPVTNILRLAVDNRYLQKSQLEIFDVLGELILKSEIRNTQEEINVSDLPRGVYYLKIYSEGKSAVKKFVKM